MRILIAGAVAVAALSGVSVAAQNYTLNTSRDASPDGAVLFTINVPYALRDIHPDAAQVGFSCGVSIGLPRTAGGATYNTKNFSSGAQYVDLTGIVPGEDGFRSATGTLSFEVSVPAEDASNMLRAEARSNYRCEVGIDDDPSRPGSYVINNSTADNLSFPHWAKGTSSGLINGRINLPTASNEPAIALPTIDRDLIKKKSPLPKNTPKLPKKD